MQPLPLLVSRVNTAALAFPVLLTDFSNIWARLRCYKNITSETQLSSFLQGGRGHPSFQHCKRRGIFPMGSFPPCTLLAPLQMLGNIPPTLASQAPLPSKQTDGIQDVTF